MKSGPLLENGSPELLWQLAMKSPENVFLSKIIP